MFKSHRIKELAAVMEPEKKLIDAPSDELQKPNYMLMSLQRILVIFVILVSVLVVVYYTPMPGKLCFISTAMLIFYACRLRGLVS